MIRNWMKQIHLSEQQPEQSRRRFLQTGLGACGILALPLTASIAEAAIRKPYEKKLSFLNLHTGERTRAVYWASGRYIPEGMRAINHVLRDHRTDERRARCRDAGNAFDLAGNQSKPLMRSEFR